MKKDREPRSWQRWLQAVTRYRLPDDSVLLGTAVLVGFGTGLGAVAFRWMIGLVTRLSFDWLPAITAPWGRSYVVIAPAVGGLIVGPMIYLFAREAKGHGVPEVMEAVARRGGRIRPMVALVKSLASSLCIGTGGSVGREGPIVQIGSTLGSTVGQVLRLSDDGIRNLVACGAAGGIAATFNAPIAGVIFALEVILGNFTARAFGTVVLSSVTASVVGRAAFGNTPAFDVPHYAILSLWEFPMYLVLGVIAALVAVAYTRAIYAAEDLFDSWRGVPEWFKPTIGGAALGLMALVYGSAPGLGFDRIPQVFGVGYETISAGLHGREVLGAMLALVGLKIVATALTLGSGGSGGVFAPSLFVGSMLGGAFGLVMQQLFPGVPAPVGAYALVGMGAVFAGSTHASMTAVIIIFEMTGDYKIVLPLMLTVVTAALLSARLMKHESIYTLKLTRRGVRLQRGRDVDVLEAVRVSEVMGPSPTVLPDTPVAELTTLFLRTNWHGFPVVDAGGKLIGVVSLSDVRAANNDPEKRTVEDLMTRTIITGFPDETLGEILRRMGPRDLSRLPIVSQSDPQQLLGVVRRNDVVRAYNLALTRRGRDGLDVPASLRRAETVEFLDLDLPTSARCIGRTVAEWSRRLPAESLLISIRRSQGEVVFPHGDTRFRDGDRITAFARRDQVDALRRCFLEA